MEKYSSVFYGIYPSPQGNLGGAPCIEPDTENMIK